MKYENAKDVLPPELIGQIQKYAAGKLLYIPKKEEAKAWGSVSGTRQKLLKRNQRIYQEYVSGKSMGELAEQYFLSTDSIKKIVYGKKEELLDFALTLENAIRFHEAGLAEEWLRAYYAMEFGEDTYPEGWICDGLVKMPLRLISETEELSGYGGNNATEPEKTKREECRLPLILRFTNGKFIFQGDTGFLDYLREQHINAYPAFVFVTDKKEYAAYVNNYGKHFHQGKLG